MKKIMFNDKYGLTQAVLEGRKTQTRRIITPQPTYNENAGNVGKVMLMELIFQENKVLMTTLLLVLNMINLVKGIVSEKLWLLLKVTKIVEVLCKTELHDGITYQPLSEVKVQVGLTKCS